MTIRNCSAKSVPDAQNSKQDQLLHEVVQGETDLWLAALRSSTELEDERLPDRLRVVFLNS